MINKVFEFSDCLKDNRTVESNMIYAMAEMGELSEEINIKNGFSDKPEGKDGIVGEAVDVIISLLDLIKLHDPDITEKEVLEIVDRKLLKWKNKRI